MTASVNQHAVIGCRVNTPARKTLPGWMWDMLMRMIDERVKDKP